MNDEIRHLKQTIRLEMKTIATMAKEIKQLIKEKQKLALQAYKEIDYSDNLQKKIDKLEKKLKEKKNEKRAHD